jgi:propionyl-CoA synthetase
MRKIIDGEKYTPPSTIDDPAILDEIDASVKPLGYGQKAALRS